MKSFATVGEPPAQAACFSQFGAARGKADRPRDFIPPKAGQPQLDEIGGRAGAGSRQRRQVSGVNVPVESTTPSAPPTLQSLSPAAVPAGAAASGGRSSDPSGSRAKSVTPLGST